MKIAQLLSKPSLLVATLGLFVITFSSCHREGCPGQITKVDTVTVEQSC